MNSITVSYSSALHFLSVAKHMSMSKAAQELFITQAALSQSISKLEGVLGVTLFYRNGNKLVLSKDAEMLLPYFETLRRSHDALVAQAVTLSETRNDALNIGFSGSAYTFSAIYYSNLLNSFHGQDIRLTFVTDAMALALLLAGQLDFVISTTGISHPLVSSQVLATDSIGVVLQKDHPLAKADTLTIGDLQELAFHGLSTSHHFRQLCDELCRSMHLTLRYVTEDDYPTYHSRLFGGMNWSECGFLSAKSNFDTNLSPMDKFVFKEVEGGQLSQNTSIYYLLEDKKQYRHSELLDLLRDVASQARTLTSQFSSLVHDGHEHSPLNPYPHL